MAGLGDRVGLIWGQNNCSFSRNLRLGIWVWGGMPGACLVNSEAKVISIRKAAVGFHPVFCNIQADLFASGGHADADG